MNRPASTPTHSARAVAPERRGGAREVPGTKYVGQKRFGIEGAESAIPILDRLLADARTKT